ncbi:hypothetical protein EV189_1436 [Motilibacter rhizosphaerae]|uniref:Pilus assembly protein CpaE n=1 Tax=Motilibacter rhizosphaerae TaxID=598652 RepID=A0A4Q7NRQ4_9ACTN|nr:pilus assembly protein CpaE [Motilibacter rhizosphaerae]RZS89665.1 hypothetical protein EV189_1436 [Motilibacter rhizosphaerae]
MVSFELAVRLRDAGLRWEPTLGDRFSLHGPEMIDEVFVLSNMVADVHQFPDGAVIGFNGTTEWALDSVGKEDAVWLPAEHQLRERLGAEFMSLGLEGGRYSVRLRNGTRVAADDAGEAYALALLHLLDPTAALDQLE